MCGIMQSRLPTDYGGEPRSHSLVDDVPTLAETLSGSGFECGGWHSNIYTSRNFDYQRGFDVFADLESDPVDRKVAPATDELTEANNEGPSLVELAEALSQSLGVNSLGTKLFYILARYGLVDHRPHVHAERVLDGILEWITDQDDDAQRFGWGHFMDLHSPYLPPAEYRDRVEGCPTGAREVWEANERLRLQPQDITDEQATHLRSLYEAGALYVDDQISRLVDKLKASGQWSETLLVVTADHGELFEDCNVPDDYPWGHANYLCDYITHVPLIIAGGAVDRRTIDGVTSGMDVAPTIVNAVDESIPGKWRGSPVGSEAYNQREYVYSVTGRGTRQDQTESEIIPSDTLHFSMRNADSAVL